MTGIVLLNGTPSAGKTTLAVALQDRLTDPYWHLSLDDFCAGYRPWLPSLFSRTLAGYLPALRAMAAAGNDLIVEAVITPANAGRYFELFAEFTVYFVGVRCPLDVALRREAARSDRGRINLHTSEFDAVHDNPGYDVETDTSAEPTRQATIRIASYVESEAHPAAFDRLGRSAARP